MNCRFSMLFLIAAILALASPAPADGQVTDHCVQSASQFQSDSARLANYRQDSRGLTEGRMTANVVFACGRAALVPTVVQLMARLDSALARVRPETVRVTRTDSLYCVGSPCTWSRTPPAGTPPPPPDPTPVPPPPAGGGLAFYTNRPTNYSNVVTDESFSDPLPAGHEIRFGDGWRSTWNDAGLLRRTTDSSAPVSPTSVYESFYSRTGTIGGNGVGDMYHPLPNARQVFIGLAVKYDPNFEWNNTSTKLLILWAGTSPFHLQARYNNRALTPYVNSQQVTTWTGSIPLGQWNRIELLADAANSRVKVWLNGTLVQDAAFTFPSGAFTSLTLDSTWGGGGTKTRDSWRWVDHIVVATP